MKKYMAIVVLIILAISAGSIYTQLQVYSELMREERTLRAELAKEEEALAKLKKEQEHYMSDAYVQKIAREHLGLVYQDEIVFMNDTNR